MAKMGISSWVTLLLIFTHSVHLLAQAPCEEYPNNGIGEAVKPALSKIYKIMKDHEFFELKESDIIYNASTDNCTCFCPQSNQIVISQQQTELILRQLNLMKEESSIDDLPVEKIMVGLHAAISHESAHYFQKKDGFRTEFEKLGQMGNQISEYHADFIAGYVNGRSLWLVGREKAALLCISDPAEVLTATLAVADNDLPTMNRYFGCLAQIMGDYQLVNALAELTHGCTHGKFTERRKAYLNGFVAALNYGIKDWNVGDNIVLSAILIGKFGSIDTAKNSFADNLFGFLKMRYPELDPNLWRNKVIKPMDHRRDALKYVQTLDLCDR